MRVLLRLLILAGIGFAAAASCSLNTEGALDGDLDGGGGVGGGTVECWVGQKFCDGKCFDQNDPQAGCGSSACDPCIVPNANATCKGNACAVETCLQGFQDCDKNEFVPGCEINVFDDPKHCGGCVSDGVGEDCTLRGPNWICKNGSCEVTDCIPTTTGDCDGNKGNGCEIDLTSDVLNCGFCGNDCNRPNASPGCEPDAATNGKCTFTCNQGYADCNSQDIDGCEINLQTDTGHCGACNNVCQAPTNGIPVCANGSCNFVCSSPYTKCAGVGTCIDLQTDKNHCGSCGNKCADQGGGSGICVNGKCEISCPSPYTLCGSTCVDLQSNKNHCSSCGNSCQAPTGGSAVCNNGACQKVCPGSQTVCNNTCVDTSTNNSHCGSCGNGCSGGKTCQSGSCKCPGTLTDCGGQCVDCSGGKVCQGTSCGCPSPTTVCGTTCQDCTGKTCCGGSCIDTQSDADNCGNCGVTCQAQNGSNPCVSGTCTPSCDSGFGDCDSNPNNGCETNTDTSSQHCGGCGNDCGSSFAGGAVCKDGSCECPTNQPLKCSDNACHECCGNPDCPGGSNNCCNYACKTGPC